MKRTEARLLCCVGTLLALGTVMVFSVISARATTLGVGTRYLAKGLIWVAIGVAGLAVMRRIDYRRLERYWWVVGLMGLTVLVAVLVPGVGTLKNGARRWIQFGPIGFQPSEFAKLAVLVTVCAMACRMGERIRDVRRGLLPCMGVVAAASALIFLEPDFGTAALVGMMGTAVVLAAGAPLGPIAAAGGVGVGAVSVLIRHSPHRLARVFAFLNPWKYYDGAGYQVIHSLTSLGSGGIFGRGLGASRQKLFYLPESDTDFLFAIIGEELGLIGTVAVVFLFAVIVREGMRISARAPDAFGALLAYGLVLMIALQAVIHMAVVTASMPTKGIALPFVSAGGSSLLASMMGLGILLNIASQAPAPASREIQEISRREEAEISAQPGL